MWIFYWVVSNGKWYNFPSKTFKNFKNNPSSAPNSSSLFCAPLKLRLKTTHARVCVSSFHELANPSQAQGFCFAKCPLSLKPAIWCWFLKAPTSLKSAAELLIWADFRALEPSSNLSAGSNGTGNININSANGTIINNAVENDSTFTLVEKKSPNIFAAFSNGFVQLVSASMPDFTPWEAKKDSKEGKAKSQRENDSLGHEAHRIDRYPIF